MRPESHPLTPHTGGQTAPDASLVSTTAPACAGPFRLNRQHQPDNVSPLTARILSASVLLMSLCLGACGSGSSGNDTDSGSLLSIRKPLQDQQTAPHRDPLSSTTAGDGHESTSSSTGSNGSSSGDASTTGHLNPLPPSSAADKADTKDNPPSDSQNNNGTVSTTDSGSGTVTGPSSGETTNGQSGSPHAGQSSSGPDTPDNSNTPQPPVNSQSPDNATGAPAGKLPGSGSDAGAGAGADTDDTPSKQNPGADVTPKPDLSSQQGRSHISPVCAPVLSHAKPLASGTLLGDMADAPRPATGVAHEDPDWHSCVVRLTHQAESHSDHPLYTPHAAQQAFNADDSALLLRTDHGEWHIFDPQTARPIRKLQYIAGDAEPQWDPKDPKVLYYLNVDGKDMKIFRLTIDISPNGTDRVELMADMAPEIRQYWPDATHARTRGGTPSDDGHTWCFMADMNDGDSWRTRGLFTWDMQAKHIVGVLKNPPASPEYITTSPSGSHCVVQYPYSVGVRAYKKDFSAPYNQDTADNNLQLLRQPYQKYGDVARTAWGDDVYLGFNVFSAPHQLYMVNLRTGEQTKLLETSFGSNSDTGIQVSGRAFNRPGWVLISGFGERDQGVNNLHGNHPKRTWFHRKMFALSLENPPKTLSIASLHHDWDSSKNSEWPRPHGTVNRNFTRMLFNSNWNSLNGRDLDAYLVEIQPDAIPGLPARASD
ncbi:MAG: hypothetical protein Q4B13_01760 [Lautropia sp.]|nr:hypothetical protein [Lautropia sp.]